MANICSSEKPSYQSDLYQDYAYGHEGDQDASDRLIKLKSQIKREVAKLLKNGIETVRILDIGCGDGFFLELLNSDLKGQVVVDQEVILYGTDISHQAVDTCRSKGFHCEQSDANEKMPYEDGFFNIVFSTEVIEHLVDTDSYISEAKRVTGKGGSFIITTPNLAAWFNRILLFLGFQPVHTEVSLRESYFGRKMLHKISGREQSKPVGHLRLFTLKALADFLKFHGFEIRQIRGYYYHKIPLNRIISNLSPSLADGMIIMGKVMEQRP